MSVENVENHMAHTCKCGSVNFALLKSGAIECNKCSDVMSEAKWLSAQPVEEHSLSLSYQIRRAIKAEDALRTAKQEVANLNELLNASYVDPTGKSGLSALLKKVFWPSKLDKEILELVASQAIELEELGKEVTCIPDMREEIVYLKAQIAAKQAQPERAPLSDKFLQPNDYHLLDRFIETTEDDESYDITKAEIKRLADLGVVQSHGFGKYSVTMFGYWVHERYWEQNPSLPLKTNADRNAEAAHGIKQAQPATIQITESDPSPTKEDLLKMKARKDAAYLERNQLVSLLSKIFPSGKQRTAIEGWSEDWHECVFIDLPTGQASWHYHDSQAYLFEHLPPYNGQWDGHTTAEKYVRIGKFMPLHLEPEPSQEWPATFQTWYQDLPNQKPEALWPIWKLAFDASRPEVTGFGKVLGTHGYVAHWPGLPKPKIDNASATDLHNSVQRIIGFNGLSEAAGDKVYDSLVKCLERNGFELELK